MEKARKEEAEAKEKAEKEALKAKEKAEKEEAEAKAKAEKEARKAREKAEKEAAEAKAKAEKEAAETKAKADKEVKKAKEKAEKEAAETKKREKEEMKRREKEERKAAKKAKKQAKKQAAMADPLAVPEVSFDTESGNETKKTRKKGKAWLWILLTLLLLLLGCAAVVYFYKPANEWFADNILKQKQEQKETADLNIDNMVTNSGQTTESEQPITEVEQPTTDDNDIQASPESNTYTDACLFSLSEQLTGFDASDIDARADAITDYISGYVTRYLNEKHYSTAKVPMMERIRQYSVSRLSELLDNSGYSEERFFSGNDYVSDFLSGYKKFHKGRQKQVTVQGEIMDRAFLDNMLATMVDELGLKADNAKVVMPPAPQKPEKPVIKTERKSRQGFDLIAGFYTDVNTAQKMVDRLKGYGCNAYIIEINHGYYVSMGSAKTRTLAEEKFRKAKEWYDGDLSIKNFQ